MSIAAAAAGVKVSVPNPVIRGGARRFRICPMMQIRVSNLYYNPVFAVSFPAKSTSALFVAYMALTGKEEGMTA